jgi:hypothetical protein
MLAREFPDRHEIWGPQSPWTGFGGDGAGDIGQFVV